MEEGDEQGDEASGGSCREMHEQVFMGIDGG